MMQKFWDLLQSSVIIQGLLTVMVTAVWLYMMVIGQTVPPSLENITGLVIGFYFGGKFVQAVAKAGMR